MSKVILVHAEWCKFCPSAMKFWKDLKTELDFDYEEVDIDSDKGQQLASEYSVMSVPTTIIDDEVAFVGVPDKEEALEKLS
ncbi:glutaredoxin family protein [Methanosalsum natronophilum]|uniref:Thioredoxin family protein n=1 Tax=Methanosalsum natronophilum TaxID=768733 RepID=A0A424YTV3_9EURY|nr:thioredoxin family protein [Methanosalsum natronophilum]MCS3924855.1 glutaredoxin [Methanosalsum natronophilum]RQD82376.1 MAG: thioredoxin family protein [Methanosalsum natronophilum]